MATKSSRGSNGVNERMRCTADRGRHASPRPGFFRVRALRRTENYFPIFGKQLDAGANQSHNPPVPSPQRGTYHGRRETLGAGCGGRGSVVMRLVRVDERHGCVRRSRVVLTPRRWRQVGDDAWIILGITLAMVANKPGHQGEHDISRKAIAQGRPECLRFTCMLVCAFSVHQCTRDRGCSAHPVFPAPSSFGAECNCKTRAKCCRENERVCFIVIASEAKQSSSSLAAPGLLRFARNDGF